MRRRARLLFFVAILCVFVPLFIFAYNTDFNSAANEDIISQKPFEIPEARNDEFSDSKYNNQEIPSTSQLNDETGQSPASTSDILEKRNAIVSAFRYSWNAYKNSAFGHDTLHPLSKSYEEWFGMGLSIVDSLDTALIMKLDDIVDEGTDWIEKNLAFERPGRSNVFEVTIRVMGGLLSLYAFTERPVFLQKAQELADRMLPAFDSQTGIPFTSFDFSQNKAIPENGGSSTSEATTLQLEWKYLSILTGNLRYWEVAEKAMRAFIERDTLGYGGILPIIVDPSSGNFQTKTVTLGARGDSYYEYLAKQYIQTGKEETKFSEVFEQALDSIYKHMRAESVPNKLVYVAEFLRGPGQKRPKMDHLVCFLPGTIALHISQGKKLTPDDIANMPQKYQDWLGFAEDLMKTCFKMYTTTATGLSPEIVYFNDKENGRNEDIIIKNNDAFYILRPETVESLFYLYRITGGNQYREMGWQIFQSIEKYAKLPNGDGYASVSNVQSTQAPKDDKMESFFMGETLKYLFLLFSEGDLLPLDKYVFNTEAHPFPIVSLTKEFKDRLLAENLGLWK